jgi:hypothetical protein
VPVFRPFSAHRQRSSGWCRLSTSLKHENGGSAPGPMLLIFELLVVACVDGRQGRFRKDGQMVGILSIQGRFTNGITYLLPRRSRQFDLVF